MTSLVPIGYLDRIRDRARKQRVIVTYDYISKLQKKVVRTITHSNHTHTHSNYIAHSEPLLKDLNLLNVKDLMDLKK